MKHFFIALTLIAIFSSPSFAGEVAITLAIHDVEDKIMWDKDLRSIVVAPTVTHEANIIYIYSNILLDNIEVSIKDYNNITIYSTIITVFPKQKTSIALNATNGRYIINLTYNKKKFYGFFELKE